MKRSYDIPNRNSIDLSLHHAETMITDHTGTHPGDDEILLVIPDFAEYDTDLCQDGSICLHFSKAEARRLSRILWQVSANLMTAQERREAEDTSDRPGIIVDPDFFNDFCEMFEYGKRKKAPNR